MRIFTVFIICWMSLTSLAQPNSYPTGSNVIDVTQAPYYADPTGLQDASTAINQALEDYNNKHAIIYLPTGTYRISQQLQWGTPTGCGQSSTYTCQRYVVLAGAGIHNTILKLDDHHPDFQDVSQPKPLITTGTTAATSFENGLRNLSINTGSNNPAAIALFFQANNNGGLQNLHISSNDGKGSLGLSLKANQVGPCLIRDVEISGFDIGIETFANQNSITLEHITLSNQHHYGIFNRQQILTIRDLNSSNQVPAIYNHKDGGSTIVLIDSDLSGSGDAAIINDNERELFVRNTQVSGYNHAIREVKNGFTLNKIPVGYISEYTTKTPLHLCNNLEQSLQLPIQESPTIQYAPIHTWANIADYGAILDNGTGDDAAAFTAAFNSGAATILVPGPKASFPMTYALNSTVTIPASVKHIIGARGKIVGTGKFDIAPSSEVLIIEDFSTFCAINHNSNRPIFFKNTKLGPYTAMPAGGSGNIYLEDVNGGPFHFKNQQVWARQLNVENTSTNIINDGGTLWILGLKTEKKATIIHSKNGAKTEVLGCLVYANTPEQQPANPMFVVEESAFSVAGLKELNYTNDPYDIKLRETRNQQTQEWVLPNSEIRTELLVAYISTAPNLAPTVYAGKDQIIVAPNLTASFQAAVNDDANTSNNCYVTTFWSQISPNSLATIDDINDLNSSITFPHSGRYEFELTAFDGSLSRSDTITFFVFDHFITTADHNQDGIPSGLGADAPIAAGSHSNNNFGALSVLAARHYNGSTPSKSLLRLDLTALGTVTMENALLELELATTNSGLIGSWSYNVFGLNDGHPAENWEEGNQTGSTSNSNAVTWNNAPGFSNQTGGAYDPMISGSGGVLHNEASFLGIIQTQAGVREKVRFSNAALRDFINADTDGKVTFLITRSDFHNNVNTFATKEHTQFQAPKLYLDYQETALSKLLITENTAKNSNKQSASINTLDQFSSTETLQIIPNPTTTKNSLQIIVPAIHENGKLIIRDLLGNIYIHQSIAADHKSLVLSTRDLLPGIYLVTWATGSNTITKQLVVIE